MENPRTRQKLKAYRARKKTASAKSGDMAGCEQTLGRTAEKMKQEIMEETGKRQRAFSSTTLGDWLDFMTAQDLQQMEGSR